jgi:hypothetical protein
VAELESSTASGASGEIAPPEPRRGALAATRVGSLVMRVMLGACGVALIAGFFMRWLTLGDMVSVSGFSLIVTEGEMVSLLSGAHRVLLFAVPVFGILLVVAGAIGHRFGLWVALITGVTVLGFGMYTVIRLFLESTGAGLWIVIGASLLALALSLIGIGRSAR